MDTDGICFSRVILAIGLGFVTALYLCVARQPDLEGIEGLGLGGRDHTRNLLELLQDSAADERSTLALTEREVNAYLGRTLAGRQQGLTGFVASFDGAYVDFLDGAARVVLVHEVLGRPFVMTCTVAVEAFDQEFITTARGSSIGRLRVRNGVIRIVMHAFRGLAAVYEPEISLLSQMKAVRFEDGRMVLDLR